MVLGVNNRTDVMQYGAVHAKDNDSRRIANFCGLSIPRDQLAGSLKPALEPG